MRVWIWINPDPRWSSKSRCIYTVNHKSRFTSVLRVVLKDAMLTQCDFYHILKHDAIRAPVSWSYMHCEFIVDFKCKLHTAIDASGIMKRNRIDMDQCSCVASPNDKLTWDLYDLYLLGSIFSHSALWDTCSSSFRCSETCNISFTCICEYLC